MASGIYKITNIKTGKFYLGSSSNLKKRWKIHKSSLRHNRHHSIHLQRAWNKYGEKSFKFEIVEEIKDNLLEVEQKYLDELKPYETGYNTSKVAGGGDLISYHPDRETIKEKHSINGKLRWKNKTKQERQDYADSVKGSNNPNWKGGISSIKFKCPICGKETGTSNKNTSSCMECSDKSGKNNAFYGKHHTDEVKIKLSRLSKLRGNINNVQKLSVEVDGVVYSSFSEAAKKLDCVTATIRNRLNNPIKFPNYKLVTQP